MFRGGMLVVVLSMVAHVSAARAEDVVRYDGGRLTVSVSEAPLDRVLGEIVAVTHATIQGSVGARAVSIDFKDMPLNEGLGRIFGAESFMLTYAPDGTLRKITMLAHGEAAPPPLAPPAAPSVARSPHPPLVDEEQQAAVLQRTVQLDGALARAIGGKEAPIGRVLHAIVQEGDPDARAVAREAALAAFTRDPEIEAAYLSTLTPVDDAVLANILRSAGPEGAAEAWMAALAERAPSPALRAKASAVRDALH